MAEYEIHKTGTDDARTPRPRMHDYVHSCSDCSRMLVGMHIEFLYECSQEKIRIPLWRGENHHMFVNHLAGLHFFLRFQSPAVNACCQTGEVYCMDADSNLFVFNVKTHIELVGRRVLCRYIHQTSPST